MIKDIMYKNEIVKPNTSALEILGRDFPMCFDTAGVFDIEKFRNYVETEDLQTKKEGYGLNFLGKSYAYYQSNLDSETVIVPDKSNKNNSSKNVYIVGDNIDALQHLKHSYENSIKCVYIDPPYNTGSNDFIYNDKFGFTAEEMSKKLDITEEEAQRIIAMNGKCTHSAWLTFMYPRLKIAKDLLTPDGVIFISINDNEQANLKLLCDEIFGEGNFIGEIIREGIRGGSKSQNIRVVHDYVLCYGKDYCRAKLGGIAQENIVLDQEDEYGKYKKGRELNKWGAGSRREDSPSMFFPIMGPNGEEVYPIRNDGSEGRWRLGKKKMAKCLAEHNAMFEKRENGTFVVYEKIRDCSRGEKQFTTLFLKNYLNSQGTEELKDLFNRERAIFDYSKPTKLIKDLILMVTEGDDLVLDFFSGSATTGDAVMQLNLEDGDCRRYIMVQLMEPVKPDSEAEHAGFKTIDEIGRARLRKAAEKIEKEHQENNVDLGFKTYYLITPKQNTIDKIMKFDPNALTNDGNLLKIFGIDTIIETWKIKDGFTFDACVSEVNIDGYIAYQLKNERVGVYLYLLENMGEKNIKELIYRLEAFEINPDKIIIYGYSFDFNSLNSLKTNLRSLKNRNPYEIVIRY